MNSNNKSRVLARYRDAFSAPAECLRAAAAIVDLWGVTGWYDSENERVWRALPDYTPQYVLDYFAGAELEQVDALGAPKLPRPGPGPA